MATHHPSEEVLVAYASGALSEPLSLLVATHLTLCPGCRDEVRDYEALGGILLEELPPAPIAPDCLAAVFRRLDEAATAPRPAARPAPVAADPRLPQPLCSYINGGLDRLRWASVKPGLRIADLRLGRHPVRTRLLRAQPGTSIPRHTHAGTEAMLVLAGGFTDEHCHCRRGDVRFADETVTHRQVIDPDEECLCLLVTDGPVRLTGLLGLLGRFVNHFSAF